MVDDYLALGNAALPGMRHAQRRGARCEQMRIAEHMVAAVAVLPRELQQRPDGDVGADTGGFTGGYG